MALCFFCFALSFATNLTQAATVPVANPGFEDFVLDDTFFTRTFSLGEPNIIVTPNPVPGWSLNEPDADGGTWNPSSTSYSGEAFEGRNVAYSNTAILSQVLSDSLIAFTKYELSVVVGNRLDASFGGYTVQLLAGGVLLAQDENSLAPASGEYVTSVVEFETTGTNALIGQALEIRLGTLPGVLAQVNFDDVKLEAVSVPEPTSLVLLALGSLGLLRRGKTT